MMTDQAYIAAYQALIEQYFSQQATMAEHLQAVQVLKDGSLENRAGAELPAVP